MRCPNSLVVKHVLGKDESQVRFRLGHQSYILCCKFVFLGIKFQLSKVLYGCNDAPNNRGALYRILD